FFLSVASSVYSYALSLHDALPILEIVKMAQAAEHEFAGVRCGIMDQFASVFSRADHAIQLDCRSLEYQYVPLRMEGVKILLFNSDRKSTRLNSSHVKISYAVVCLK